MNSKAPILKQFPVKKNKRGRPPMYNVKVAPSI